MKNFIIGKSINYIKSKTDYDDIKIKEIEYGLVSIYLTITKLIVIFILSIVLGIFKETIIYMIIYNILRAPSFGLHATKSWICLLASTILFISIPYLCIVLNIPIYIKVILGGLGIVLMYKNSPADTKKRPIVNKKRRNIYKFISTLLAIIYSFIAILINNNFISNCLVFGLVMQNIMISPITYKVFNLPYNNYITFLREHPDFSN